MSTPNRLTQFFPGYCAGPADEIAIGETALDALGALGALFVGAKALQSVGLPLTFSTDGHNVTIGGSGQTAIIPNVAGRPRRCDEIGARTFGITLNTSSSVRYDIIFAQAVENAVNPQSCPVETPANPPATAIVGTLAAGVVLSVVGTSYTISLTGASTSFIPGDLVSISDGTHTLVGLITALGTNALTVTSTAQSGTSGTIANASPVVQVPAPFSTFSDGVVSQQAQSVSWGYLPGTPGGSVPSAPTGYTAILQITVPPSLGVVTTSDLALIIPTFPIALFSQIQTLLPFLTVTGADPAGINDSSVAINTVLTSAASTGIKRVILPGGTFLCVNPLVIPTGVALEGAGSGGTVLKQGTLTTDVVQFAGSSSALRSLQIVGASGATGGFGINGGSATAIHLFDVAVSLCYVGLNTTGASDWHMVDVRCNDNLNDGADFVSWSGSLFMGLCDFSSNVGIGLRFSSPGASGLGALLVGCRFALNNTGGGNAAGLQFDSGIKGLQADGCRFGQELPSPSSAQAYGVAFLGSNDDITIDGVINANAIAPIYAPSGLGGNIVIRANGYQPAAASIGSLVSGTPWQNNFGVPVQVIINPNSATITAIEVNGNSVYTSATIPASGPILVDVGAGRSLTPTFSGGAPTAIANPQ